MGWLDFSFPQFKEIVCSARRRHGTTQKAFRRPFILFVPLSLSLFFFLHTQHTHKNTYIHTYHLYYLFLLLRFPVSTYFPNALLDEEIMRT